MFKFPAGENITAREARAAERTEEHSEPKAELAEIYGRRELLQNAEAYSEMLEQIRKQRELNEKIMENGIRLAKLRKELEKIGNDRTFFYKRIKNLPAYEDLERKINALSDATLDLWRERRDAAGNIIDLRTLIAEKTQLEKKVKAGLGPFAGAKGLENIVQKLREQVQKDAQRAGELERIIDSA